VLENAISQNLPTASMINKAGATVVASSQSVGFAIMDKGGNLNSLFQANLADGSSSNVWPISGFTYFLIRKNSHVAPGNCKRRSAAMEYLYNFYNSPTVAESAQKLGFAALPQFIASIIVKQLVDHAMCDNGQYALAKHRVSASPLLSASVFTHTLDAYISAYTAVDPTAIWNIGHSDVSTSIWSQFSANPAAVSGAFTMFPSRAAKLSHYNRADVLTSSFAHVAVVMLYHLNAYSNANPATGNTGKNGPLRLTADIIGGILAGKVTLWNDSLIQAANPATKNFLPYMPIYVVVRSLPCDTNSLIFRFLREKSAAFSAAYIASGTTSTNQFNFSANIPSSRLILTASSTRVDSYVTALDGSFGYYLQNTPPASPVASYCFDPTCSQLIADPTALSSISACESDSSTIVNPREQLFTYDLMSSTAPGCYPIVGTVDYSLLAATDNTCNVANSTYRTVLKDRIRFGSWLFSSPVIVQPLASNYVLATPSSLRDTTFQQVCDVTCNGAKYGYAYCGYRDCSYASGDYTQEVSECDPETGKKSVTYRLAPNSTCIQNPATIPPSVILVGCPDVLGFYQYGKIAIAMSIIGMAVCAFVIIFVVVNRKEKIIKKSQPIFIYIFITGAFLMNLSILAFIGPNNDRNCLLRPWSIDISTTIMFAPLLMKLHRIDMLFRSSKKLKKTMIKDHTVREMTCLLHISPAPHFTPRQILIH
jgi:ABC-type phosphate transport system substrate-binding protein